MKPLPRYVQLKRSKGKPYLYFRRADVYQRLPSDPSSAEFAREYARLLSIENVAEIPLKPGSVMALIADFKRSARWAGLAEQTRREYARALDRLEPIAQHPFADVRRRHVRELRDTLGLKPRAADAWITAVASLFKHAVDDDLIDMNPAHGIADISRPTSYRRWTQLERETFEVGIRDGRVPGWAATAYHLAGWLSSRRANVIALRWEHYDGRRMRYRPVKGGHAVDTAVPGPLRAYLDALPREGSCIVSRTDGGEWKARHFSRLFRRVLDSLGLQGLHLHGLRHTASSELAELGASEDHIMSLTGQRSPQSARVYVKQARRRIMADEAIAMLERGARNRTRKRETGSRSGKPALRKST